MLSETKRGELMAIFIVLLSALLMPFTSQAESLEPVQAAVGAAKANASRFYIDRTAIDAVITGSSHNEEALRSMEVLDSPDFKQKVEREQLRLQREVFGTQAKETTYYSSAKKSGGLRLAGDERVYLFVSSSIPESTLRAYVQDIAKLKDPNIIIVLRGFIGGMKHFQPTMKFITDLLKKDQRCEGAECPMYEVAFEIDPSLYRRFRPSQVPALVYARGVTVGGQGVSEGFDAKQSQVPNNPWWVIYGDASLSYLFARISAAADSPLLDEFSKNIE
jgi:conjugal transfer pilus assembly protein TrbC